MLADRFQTRLADASGQLPVATNSKGDLFASEATTLQINIGLQCNLACKHCHVESSPKRTADSENMSAATVTKILRWLEAAPSVVTVDLTGGSPEMNPNFRDLVQGVKRLGRHVIDRCNPTILVFKGSASEPHDYDWVPEFLAQHEVEVFASMPCYLPDNVRKQRGLHAFDDSVEGLRLLNQVGYGRNPKLRLNLVYNPTGASLPPPAESLEADYRRELKRAFDIDFTSLVTITNMPIARWRSHLDRAGQLEAYESLLADQFNAETVDGLMCRHQIHIDSQGRLFDCDFNYASNLPAMLPQKFLWDVTPTQLAERRIATDDHCFGCTAGSGSSCTGSIA